EWYMNPTLWAGWMFPIAVVMIFGLTFGGRTRSKPIIVGGSAPAATSAATAAATPSGKAKPAGTAQPAATGETTGETSPPTSAAPR
ncbi:MAG TPA: hypothetical protein VGE52_03965, partial [Pirellulales bacterium]